MQWSVLLVFGAVLSLVAFVIQKEVEPRLFWKIALIFLSVIVSFNIDLETFRVVLPLGLALAWWRGVRRADLNKALKSCALYLACGAFIMNQLIPPVGLQGLWRNQLELQATSQFQDILSVYTFSDGASVQEQIAQHYPYQDEPHLMLMIWALTQRGIPMRDDEHWLSYFIWDYAETWAGHNYDKDRCQVLLTMKTGESYYAVFKRIDESRKWLFSSITEYRGMRTAFPSVMDPSSWRLFR